MTNTTKPQPGSVSFINTERFRETCLFAITIRRFGNSARVKDMAALEAYLAEAKQGSDEAAKNGAAPSVFIAGDRVKSTKALLRSPRLNALNKAMTQLKAGCEANAMPSYFRPGMFVVKQASVPIVEATLKEGWLAIQGKELRDFLAGYAGDVEAARTTPVKKGGLGPLWKAADYATLQEAEKQVGIEWYWLALSVPENIPAELRAEANEKFKRRMDDAAEQIQQALRGELLDLIAHAEERLTPVPGERPKVFRDSAIANILDFLKTFDGRDVFSDEALKPIVEQAKAVMLDEKGNPKINPQKLRDWPSVRDTARESFSKIRAQLDLLVEDQGRRLDLSE